MINNLSTNDYRLQNAIRLQNDVANSNSYYFFAGNYLNNPNNSPQPIYQNVSNTLVDAYTNMITGKKINGTNVQLVINNNQWVANTVYSMYDDLDPNLINEKFYIITSEGSFYHIWKCLDNNVGAASTVQPLFAFAASSPYFQTSDGYRWKYMATVSNALAAQFQLANYFPVVANTTVQAAAVPGALDIFLVQNFDGGAFYNNYISGTFASDDIFVNGDQTLFNIANNVAVATNGYYTGCLLYLTGGSGQGQYATVINYQSNTTGNILKLATPFITPPQNGTTFQVNPQLTIISDGNQTVNCVARALVNALASNSIYRCESLQTGQNYFKVGTISVSANAVVGITNTATIRAIMSPRGGHGANVYAELFCNSIGVSVTLANSETNTILTTNDYKQIGILNYPLFANVNFKITSVQGSFTPGETIYSYTQRQVDSGVTITNASSNIICSTANFVTQFSANQYILMALANNAISQLVQVSSIVNSSQLSLVSPATFTTNTGILYELTFPDSAIVTIGGSANVFVTNCTPNFSTGSLLVGNQTSSLGILGSVFRNDVAEFFNTFISLYKYKATAVNGIFAQNEQVSQGSNQASVFTSVVTGANAVTLYLSNFIGGPIVNGTITGITSGARGNVSQGYLSDIVFGSGDVLYLENINAVTRTNTQSETFQLVLSF
jgi:hypothetical protein